MFIVKKRSELIKFGLFLLAVGLMAFYVTGRFAAWRQTMAGESQREVRAAAPATPAGQAKAAPADQAKAGAQATPAPQAKSAAVSPILGGSQQGADLAARAQATSDGSDFFAEFRMERERSRAALTSTLQEVMAGQSIDAGVRKQATEQYMAVSRITSLEAQAEAMIRARGFSDVLVYLSDSAAQVVVKQKELNQAQVMQVVDMVSKVTGVKPASVVVIPREN